MLSKLALTLVLLAGGLERVLLKERALKIVQNNGLWQPSTPL